MKPTLYFPKSKTLYLLSYFHLVASADITIGFAVLILQIENFNIKNKFTFCAAPYLLNEKWVPCFTKLPDDPDYKGNHFAFWPEEYKVREKAPMHS